MPQMTRLQMKYITKAVKLIEFAQELCRAHLAHVSSKQLHGKQETKQRKTPIFSRKTAEGIKKLGLKKHLNFLEIRVTFQSY